MLKVRVGRNPHDGLAQRDLNRCRSFGHARRHCGRLWLRDGHGQQHGSSRRRAPVLQAHPVAQQVRVDAVAHRQAGDRHARHTGMFHQPSLECRGVDPFAIAHSALDHRAAPLRDVSRVLHMDTHARRSGLCHQWGDEATLTPAPGQSAKQPPRARRSLANDRAAATSAQPSATYDQSSTSLR